jgi:hypothetical protein
VFFVRVRSFEIEEELVRGGFVEEVSTVMELFDFEEFGFHEVVDGLDVGLHAMGAWEDGSVTLAGEGLNGEGVGGRIFSVPGSDVFAAVVGLAGGVVGESVKPFEEVVEVNGKEVGVGKREVVGEAEEEDSTGDFAVSVLNSGKVEEFGLEIILGDVHEVFGIFHGMLEELEAFFDGAQVIFGDVFFAAFSRWDAGLTPDFTHGLWRLREIFQDADLFGPEAFVLGFQGDDVVFDMSGSFPGRMVGLSGTVGEGGISCGLEALPPCPHDGGAGEEESGGRFDADLNGLLNHLVTPEFLVFTLSHNVIVLIRTHNFGSPFSLSKG